MKLLLHPEAEEELCRSALWYEERRSGLGDELLNEVDHWLGSLHEAPLIWPVWPEAPDLEPPIRRASLRRFPFALAYQVHEDRILVLAIAHTSRRPFYWAERVGGPSSQGSG